MKDAKYAEVIYEQPKVTSCEQLIKLAEQKKAVYNRYWRKAVPAAFFINWRIVDVHKLIKSGMLEEFINKESCEGYQVSRRIAKPFKS